MTSQLIFNQSAEKVKADFNEIVSNHHHNLDFDRECEHLKRIIIGSAQDHEQVSLYDVDTNQLCTILLEAAALGLTLSPALGHIIVKGQLNDFIPTAKMYVTYKGMQQLSFGTGNLLAINAWVIHENDRVKVTNTSEEPIVEIDNLFMGRGEVVGAFCTLKLIDGTCLTSNMTIAELDAVAEMSGNDGWFGPFKNEFRRKQVIKRALSTFYSQYCDYIIDADKYFSEYEDQINIDNTDDSDHRTPAEIAMNWNNAKHTESNAETKLTNKSNEPCELEGELEQTSVINNNGERLAIITEDAVIEDAVIEDAVTKDAVIEDAVTEDAVIEDAVTKDAVIEDAVTEDAVTEDAVIEDAVTEDAVIEDTDQSVRSFYDFDE